MLAFPVMRYVTPSREVLAETLMAAGPDSPTLCDGWRTRELAAHLYLREHRPAHGLGLMVKPLAPAVDRAVRRTAEAAAAPEDYTALVEVPRRASRAVAPADRGDRPECEPR